MLSLTNLRALLVVVDTGGVRPAALRLGRTPSAISMALKQLEASVGAPLFEGERKTRPTAICQQVIEKARELLDHYDETCATISSMAQSETNRCTIACIASFATAILPLALQRMKPAARAPEVRIRESNTTAILELVADAKVDLGFARVAAPRPDLRVTRLLTDSYVLVCRHDDPLARVHAPITWAMVQDREFILNDSVTDIESAEVAREIMEAPFLTRARYYASSVASTFALVRGNVGVALMPGLCIAGAPAELRFLPLADHRVRRAVSMITKKGRRLSTAGERVVRSIRTVAQQYAQGLSFERPSVPLPAAADGAEESESLSSARG
jgi:DNA-binding transcriptional LysR family regulator